MSLSILLTALAVTTAVTAWEQPAKTAPLDRADLVAAVDYCVAVVEADMLDAPPISNGPDGFERLDGRYGGQNWLAGSPDGRAIVAQPSGTHCSAYAIGFEAADAAEALAGREGYLPDNEASTAFLRLFEDRGGVRAGWSVLGEDEGLRFFVNATNSSCRLAGRTRLQSQPTSPLRIRFHYRPWKTHYSFAWRWARRSVWAPHP